MSYSLYVYPEVPDYRANLKSSLQDFLIEYQLAAPSSQAEVLEPGEQLMAYINFLGCSPSLTSGELHTHVYIHRFEHLTALGGQSVETVRYPGCKHPVDEPLRLLNDFSSEDKWLCPVCGNQGTIQQINWRKSAGFSTIFIEITSIFPREAIPTDKFLSLLHSFNQSSWLWFYSRSSC